MRPTAVVLETDGLVVVVEPERGCEIASVLAKASGTELLMRTPWAADAERIVTGLPESAESSTAGWMESYAGGWQVLFPHVGNPVEVDGQLRHHHGESSWIPWTVASTDAVSMEAEVTLATVPASIARRIVVEGATVTITDAITNGSSSAFRFDYLHHPAFGAEFLSSGGSITATATVFCVDPSRPLSGFEGSEHQWPLVRTAAGDLVDLSVVPPSSGTLARFGTLAGFSGPACVTVTGVGGLTAQLRWNGDDLGFAWFWQQVRASPGPPWEGRDFAIAVEPSTSPSFGPRGSTQVLVGGETRTYTLSMTVGNTTL